MDWIDGPTYGAARVDPLADVAAGILEHMNKDHPDALVVYARALGGAPDAEAATMVAVDRLGFRLRIRSAAAPARRADRLPRRGHERRRRPARPDPDAPGRAGPRLTRAVHTMPTPPESSAPLARAVAHLENREWQAAHEIVQDDKSVLAAWLHGIVHTLEGDLDNARYWYRRARRAFRGAEAVEAEIGEARRTLDSGTRPARGKA